MKFDDVKWIVLTGITLLAAILFTCDALSTNFKANNIVFDELHIKSVTKNIGGGESLNYDLYVQENNNHYQIGANWAGCFYYDSFVNGVKPGAPIRLSVLKSNGLIASSDLFEVVNIESNGTSYLNPDCAIDSVEDQKNIIPIVWAAAIGLVVYCYFGVYRKRKNIKRLS